MRWEGHGFAQKIMHCRRFKRFIMWPHAHISLMCVEFNMISVYNWEIHVYELKVWVCTHEINKCMWVWRSLSTTATCFYGCRCWITSSKVPDIHCCWHLLLYIGQRKLEKRAAYTVALNKPHKKCTLCNVVSIWYCSSETYQHQSWKNWLNSISR